MEHVPRHLGSTRFLPRVEALEDRTLAAAGALDSTFGTGGQVVLPSVLEGRNLGEAVVKQRDGKILVAGVAEETPQTQVAGYTTHIRTMVARLNADGSPDREFGTNGIQILPFILGATEFHDARVALTLDADGKILVAGNDGPEFDSNFAVARLEPQNGSLDESFGDRGWRSIDLFAGRDHDEVRALLVQPEDGNILVAGKGANDFGVVRLTTNGSLDRSFGNAGIQLIGLNRGGWNDDAATALALHGNRIVLGGYSQASDTAYDFAVVCLNRADGSLDTSFNGTGWQVINFAHGGNSEDRARGLAIQPDGKIVLAGFADEGDRGYDFAVARLNPDGSLDTGFADDGRQIIEFVATDRTLDLCNCVAIQPDGRILLAGFQAIDRTAGDIQAAVARLNPDGVLDATFNNGGRVSFHFVAGDSTDDKFNAMTIDPETGAIVLAGHVSRGRGTLFAIARLEGDPPRRSPSPSVARVVGIQGPRSAKPKRPITFLRALSESGSADAFQYRWMVTTKKGKKQRLVAQGNGPTLLFRPTSRGNYIVTLLVDGGGAFLSRLRV